MDKASLEALRLAHERAGAVAEELRRTLERAERWRKLLDTVSEAALERPAWTASALTQAQDIIRQHESEDGEAVAALRVLWQDCQERAKAAAVDSVKAFPEAVESAGLKIDRSSRHPRYSFDDHVIEIEIVERDLLAKIDLRHGEKVREPLDIPAVVSRLVAERRRLFERPWNAEKFLEQLHQAYRKLTVTSEGVVLRELAAAMAGKGRRPRLDEFAVDLGRLLRDRPLMESHARITTNQTRDTRRGLLLPGLEQGGYVLSLSIEETA